MTLAGLGTAIFLEHTRDASMPTSALTSDSTSGNTVDTTAAPIQPATMVATNGVHDPLAASAAVPAESTESPERHGSTASPPQQTARLEVAPEPAPAPAAAALPIEPSNIAEPEEAAAAPAPQYWVEYGVFTGARAAKRLQQELADKGLDTTITPTHAPDGRPLLRVRSSSLLDYGAAKAASASARQGAQAQRAASSQRRAGRG